MRYGAMNFPVKPVLDEVEKIHALGFDFLELTLDPPCAHHSDIRRQEAALRKTLAEYSLDLVCHLPTFVYTADLAPAIRKASLEEMIHSIGIAGRLGAEKAVLHPSIISGLGPLVLDKALELVHDTLDLLVTEAEKINLPLCLENIYPRYHTFFEPDHFTGVFKRYPQLKLTLDTGHANMDDPGGNRLCEFIRRFPDRIGHIHVSDNNGKLDEHLRVGNGTVNFPTFARMLKQAGYDDTVTLEIFSPNVKDLVASRNRIAALFK